MTASHTYEDVHKHVIAVHMIRPTLDAIPQFDLPPGIWARTFRPGDETTWAKIQNTADIYNHVTVDIHHRDYGTNQTDLAQRQFFLMDALAGNGEGGKGMPIASASAWWTDDYAEADGGRWDGRPDEKRGGGRWGEVHWVAVLPNWQGRGLARPLMSLVLNRMADLGETRAYLNTATARLPAINLYLRFGFVPHLFDDDTTGKQRRIWQALTPHLRYPTGL